MKNNIKDFTTTKSIDVCSDIIDICVTEHQNEVGVHIRKGAILLGVANSPHPEDENQFRFCLGWSKLNGKIPEWFKNIVE